MIDLAFIAERYNYWIFIILMMIGLYTVISRGNLIKKIVGLNIFQTSVFIYYISMGKIAGGTAPILIGGEGHGGEDGIVEGAEATVHGVEAAPLRETLTQEGGETLHAEPSGVTEGAEANDLSAAVEAAGPGDVSGGEALHAAPSANPLLTVPEDGLLTVPPPPSPAPEFEIAPPVDAAQQADAAHYAVAASQPAEVLHQATDIIYTNPLPHVLILTAIVVGVATTAVGLALAVRIREAYGTIEEDELEAADDIAEFGHPMVGETAR